LTLTASGHIDGMSASCCGSVEKAPPGTRLVLWIALAVTEIVAGAIAGSVSLQADALDFLADSFNYAITLSVIGFALTWRARAAIFKGITMGVLGLSVIGEGAWHVILGRIPEPLIMGLVGALALVSNGVVALMLYRFRTAEANLRSAWICSRNDVLGNLAVLLAAVGVFGTGTLWPDVIVATVMAALAIQGSWLVIRQSSKELNATVLAPHS
jgi:Co/Zn/Cd efflux system component